MSKNVEEHIDKRIETVDRHLECLQEELLECVKSIKEKACLEFIELKKETEFMIDENEKFSKKFKLIRSDSEINKEVTEKIYECQKHLSDLANSA